MGINLIDQITPKNDADFPMVQDTYFKGGLRIVTTTGSRDSITTERKTVGMEVYVSDDDDSYRWTGSSWNLITTGGGVSDHDDLTNVTTSQHHIKTTSADIDHTAISNIGSNTHTQIDTHVASTSNPHSVLASQISDFTSGVTNNSAVANNTVHRTSDGKNHGDVVLNNSHRVNTSNPHSVLATQISDFDTEVSNNSSVSDNTSKVTNATHTGDVTGSIALIIASNAVNDTHIDWGTGANQVSTADIPENTNLYYTDARVNSNGSVALNTTHRELTNDPHNVTATQVGLGNVSNVETDDTAYNSTSWDSNTDSATKNAIRDKVETIDTAIGLNTTHRGLTSNPHTVTAAQASAVALTGNETVSGIKTFSSSPIVPAPTTDLQASTKKYVDDSITGAGNVPGGGTTGQVLTKASDIDQDTLWSNIDVPNLGTLTLNVTSGENVFGDLSVNGVGFINVNPVEDFSETKFNGFINGVEGQSIQINISTTNFNPNFLIRKNISGIGDPFDSFVSPIDDSAFGAGAIGSPTISAGIGNVSQWTTVFTSGTWLVQPIMYSNTSTKSGSYNSTDINGTFVKYTTSIEDLQFLAGSIATSIGVSRETSTFTWPTVTAGSGEYVIIASPVSLGSHDIFVNNFKGGFEEPEVVENFDTLTYLNPTAPLSGTNPGIGVDYFVWRSTHAGLGTIEVETR